MTPLFPIEITFGLLERHASGLRSGIVTPLLFVALACACPLSPTRIPGSTWMVTSVTVGAPASSASLLQPVVTRLANRSAAAARRDIAEHLESWGFMVTQPIVMSQLRWLAVAAADGV